MKYKHWECMGCGNEVMSSHYPTELTRWNDGHVCRYKEVVKTGPRPRTGRPVGNNGEEKMKDLSEFFQGLVTMKRKGLV